MLAVQRFVASDELVAQGKTGHLAVMDALQPEYRTERSAEKDAFNACERHETLREPFRRAVKPLEGPAGLGFDGRDVENRVEETIEYVRLCSASLNAWKA